MITIRAFDFPLSQALTHATSAAQTDKPACVLAMIGGAAGPSFRPVGASMFVMEDGTCFGGLSSGCIDGDVAHHAAQVLKDRTPRKLRYGQGSPFMDIQLPCGGSLDIFLLPIDDITRLRTVSQNISERQPVTLSLDMERGGIEIAESAEDQSVALHVLPDTRFVVLGAGTEASAFAAMATSAGYDAVLVSPDSDTLDAARHAIPSLHTRHITQATLPPDVAIDAHTAVTLFFHNHSWEPDILLNILASPAFYIGAQGSLRTANARIETLRAAGVGEAELARIKGPIGLIRSTRDPRTLAVSVLAEVLSCESPQGQN
jgi:xanthine dehydrogenase accessory factor